MRKSKFFMLLIMLATTLLALGGTVYGAAKENSKQEWDIAFLGTLQVPAQLEIIDCKDVLVEMLKMSEKMDKGQPTKPKDRTAAVMTPEQIAETFEKNNIGIYQFALKNNGTYNTALVFAAKAPVEMKAAGLTFFDELKKMNNKQQEEMHRGIVNGMNEIFTKTPDLKNVFYFEILEFYPFEQMTNKNAQIISVGGSVAFRMYKLIQPAAFKVYFIKQNSELHMFGVINSGPDRKMWEDMTKGMLKSARWKPVD